MQPCQVFFLVMYPEVNILFEERGNPLNPLQSVGQEPRAPYIIPKVSEPRPYTFFELSRQNLHSTYPPNSLNPLIVPSTRYQNHSNFDGDRDRVPVSGRGCCSLSPPKLCHNVAVRFMEHNLSQMTVDSSLYQIPKTLQL
jgi:hypothetical protein